MDTIITDPPYGLSFMGKRWDYDVPSIEIWQEALRILKPGGTALIFGGTRTFHRMACNVEDAGFMLFDTVMWLYGSGFPKATDISKNIDKMKGAEREVVGEIVRGDVQKAKQSGSTFAVADANKNNKDIFGYGVEKITKPSTPEAQLWNGWKSHLKPAYEPIICARKPNDGTYAANAIKWGVSGLNVDGARIPTGDDLSGGTYGGTFSASRNEDGSLCKAIGSGDKGRYPANIILDEISAGMLDQQSGKTGPSLSIKPNL